MADMPQDGPDPGVLPQCPASGQVGPRKPLQKLHEVDAVTLAGRRNPYRIRVPVALCRTWLLHARCPESLQDPEAHLRPGMECLPHLY